MRVSQILPFNVLKSHAEICLLAEHASIGMVVSGERVRRENSQSGTKERM